VLQELLFRPIIFVSLFTFSVPSFSSCLGLLLCSSLAVWGARTEDCLVSLKHQGTAVHASTLGSYIKPELNSSLWLSGFFLNSLSHDLPNAVAHIAVDKVIISVVLLFGIEGEDLGSRS
jgi:hypothetical protein